MSDNRIHFFLERPRRVDLTLGTAADGSCLPKMGQSEPIPRWFYPFARADIMPLWLDSAWPAARRARGVPAAKE